jgi:hypothetical protein
MRQTAIRSPTRQNRLATAQSRFAISRLTTAHKKTAPKGGFPFRTGQKIRSFWVAAGAVVSPHNTSEARSQYRLFSSFPRRMD